MAKHKNNNPESITGPLVRGVLERNIVTEMQESYIDYAMSVIVSRALPDARDGLKPVHRRILYAMHEMGLKAGSKFVKSARVVGEVLGKYHPHGDIPVYDSLVRMAQPWSLRYPLIDGQGNFGCFTKDTKVQLTDGRNLNFEELIKEHERGKQNFTYTINGLGLISIAKIRNPRLTRKNAELIRIAIDNGLQIRCTPNHLFMMRDGIYKEAQYLLPEDSLMPLYQKLSEKTDRLSRAGYTLIYQSKKNEWFPAHHLADNYNLTHEVYKKSAGRVRHHQDFNKKNNDPTNIIRVHWNEYWKIHYEHAFQQHNNPDYRQKITQGRTAYWSQPLVKAQYATRLSKKNTEDWQNPAYRKKMRKFLSMVNKQYIEAHPEKRKELSLRATRTLKRLWQNPVYRAFMHEKIIKGNKNHTANSTGKQKFLKICKETLRLRSYLNENPYEEMRAVIYPYGAATRWQTGLQKYFQNNAELVLHEIHNNHRVIKVERLAEQEDVYDLTIDGTHNFALAAGIFVHNSIDGDSAAAMRYTESRMTKMAEEMLRDIEKNTVDFRDNYDASQIEPVVLPAAVPQLLLNGSLGIAVGMATNIPPHNLGELIDATTHLLDHPKTTTEQLTGFIKGPDFPTGGIIFNKNDIHQAYATGRGGVVNRGEAEIVEKKAGQYQIIISSIPYQVSKADMIIKMAELVQEKKLDGIKDIRDESDREGLSVAIDLSRDAHPQKVLNALYKHTDLERTFHFNMVALSDGIQPQLMGLKSLLEKFIEHRKVVVERRAKFDLAKAEDRAHILEGLKKALDHIDEVIKTIKKSPDSKTAHARLMEKFKLSDKQSSAILEMRLATLAGLERQKIEDELEEKLKLIKHLKALLKDPAKMLEVIKTELAEIKQKYGDDRKTKVIAGEIKTFSAEDLVQERETFLIITQSGYIKRVAPEEYRAQKRGGRGVSAMEMKDEDLIDIISAANTTDDLLFFTTTGKVYQTKMYEIPEGKRNTKGKAIANFLNLGGDEKVTSALAVSKNKKKDVPFLVMITENGIIKKADKESFSDVRHSGIIAIRLGKNDALKWVTLAGPGDHIILTSAKGKAVRFKESDLRPMGRTAQGVRAMKLSGDKLVGADIVGGSEKQAAILVISANGFGKKTPVTDYRLQRRGGSGIKTIKITAKTGPLKTARVVKPENEELIVVSQKGQVIRTGISQIPTSGRSTQGARIIKMEEKDAVASITLL